MFGKKKEEEFALEVLATILQTGKPEKVLNEVIERLNKSGRKKLAEKFNYLKNIYNETNPVEAFYRADLISEEVYRYLSVVQKKGLTANFVKNVLKDLRERGRAFKEIAFLLFMPVIYIVLASVIGVSVGGQFISLLQTMQGNKMELPVLLYPHLFAKEHPLLAIVLLITILVGILGLGLYFGLRFFGYKELKLYQIASVVEVLRRQEVGYADIFSFISSGEKDKNYKDLTETISLDARRLTPLEALSPLIEMLPVQVALVFSSFLERGEEVNGWAYLKQAMMEMFNSRINVLKNILPVIGFALVGLIIMYAITPMFFAIKGITKMLSGF
jgi:hypothetical protein